MDHKTHAQVLTTLVAALQIGSSKEGLTIAGKVTPEQIKGAAGQDEAVGMNPGAALPR